MDFKIFFDKTLIIIIVIIIFYSLVLIFSDFDILVTKIHDIKYEYIPLILILISLQILIQAIKYHRLLKKLEIKISFKESFLVFVAGLSMIVTPGGIGTAIKSHILKKKYGKSISSTIPIVFFERWTELLSILFIMSILLIWVDLYESRIMLLFGYLFIGLVIMISLNSKVFNAFKKLFSKISFTRKFSSSLIESQETLKILNKKTNLIEMLMWSLLAKIPQFIAVYFVFILLGLSLDILLIGQIFYTSLVLGALSFVPGGLIVVESSLLGLLLKNNIEFSTASLTIVFLRLFTIWLPTIFGAVVLKSFLFRSSPT